MSNAIKSSDIADQLQQIERYKISDEERSLIDLQLDMLDGAQDGIVDRSREEVGNNLLKIIESRTSERKVFWRDFEDLRIVMIRAEEMAETPLKPAPMDGMSLYTTEGFRPADPIDRIIDGVLAFLDSPIIVPEYDF